MSVGGNSAKETTQSVTQFDPDLKNAFLGNLNSAKQVAGQPYQPYTGQLIAPMNNLQQTGNEMSLGAASNDVGGDTLRQAIMRSTQAAGYQPIKITPDMISPAFNGQGAKSTTQPYGATGYQAETGQAAQAGPAQGYNASGYGAAQINRGDIANVQAPGFDASQLGQYMNPYTDEVINKTMADQERQRQIAGQADNAQAVAAGAFGGDRQAIVRSQTNDAYDRNSGLLSAQLRSQGYDSALNQYGQDRSMGLQALLANQGVDQNVAGQNAGYRQQASAYGADANNIAGQFNAGAQNQVNAQNADRSQAMGLANLGYGNQAAQYGADAANQGGMFNAGAYNAASEANAGRDQSMTQQNQQMGLQALLANQAAGLTAGQANQSAGLNANAQGMQAAGMLGGFADQQANRAQSNAGIIQGIGGQYQSSAQALLDSQRQQWDEAQQYPLLMQQLLNQSAGLLPNGTIGNSSGKSTSFGLNGSVIPGGN